MVVLCLRSELRFAAPLRGQMQKRCRQCNETAPTACKLSLCGRCCKPPCEPGVHSQRHAARGKKGQKTYKEKWNRFWRTAHRGTVQMWKHPPLRQHMEAEDFSFGQVRYWFFKTLLQDLHCTADAADHDTPDAADPGPVDVAACLPPREREELVDTLRQEFKLEQIPPVDTQVEPDELDDPEDLDGAWRPEEATSSCSTRRLAETTVSEEEPATQDVAGTGIPADADAEVDEQRRLRKILPAWAPEDKEPCHNAGEVCAHYRRRTPLLHKVTIQNLVLGAAPDNVGPYEHARAVLLAWMTLRPGLLHSFATVERATYTWDLAFGSDSAHSGKLHDWGAYFWCPLHRWKPEAPNAVDVQRLFDKEYAEPLTRCIHSSSMYTVHRSVQQGLWPGPSPGKGGRTGLYVFQPYSATRARSSSGYGVYSRVGLDFLVAPRYQLQVRMGMAGRHGIGKVSMGSGQLALQPGMYFVEGVWFHVLTQRDAFRGPPTWCAWDDWLPEYELSSGT